MGTRRSRSVRPPGYGAVVVRQNVNIPSNNNNAGKSERTNRRRDYAGDRRSEGCFENGKYGIVTGKKKEKKDKTFKNHIYLNGWALSQLGKVFVENLVCTSARYAS